MTPPTSTWRSSYETSRPEVRAENLKPSSVEPFTGTRTNRDTKARFCGSTLTRCPTHICRRRAASPCFRPTSRSWWWELSRSWSPTVSPGHLRTENRLKRSRTTRPGWDVRAGPGTCLQNLLEHLEGGGLPRRLVGLLVLLQHLVDLRVGGDRGAFWCRRFWWGSANVRTSYGPEPEPAFLNREGNVFKRPEQCSDVKLNFFY